MPIHGKPSITTLTDIETAVTLNLPKLASGKSYTLEQMAGSAFWDRIPKPTRLKLGQAFRAKADRGELPVVYIDTTSGNKALYQHS